MTGREAFHRENAMTTLLAVVGEQPAPVCDYNPYAPDDVVAVLAKCLAKNPGDRYQTAAALEAAFASCACAQAWTEERSSDWWAQHPKTDAGTGTDLASLPLRESRA